MSHHAEITIHLSVITSIDVIIRSPTLQQPNTELKINQNLLNPKLGGDYSCLLVVYGTRAIADTQEIINNTLFLVLISTGSYRDKRYAFGG